MGMQLSCSVGANGNWRGTQQTLRNRRYTGSTNNVTESFIETERELGEWWKQELEGSMKAAEERKLANELNRFHEGVPAITVILNGRWWK